MKKIVIILFCIYSFSLIACGEAERPRFDDSTLYVFGDSLSDTGNANIETSGLVPDKNYYSGRFSNGPLYVDKLAKEFSTPLLPSRLYGSNFAYAGDRSLGVSAQVFNFTENVRWHTESTWTYIIWSGANDLLAISQQPENANDIISEAISHIRFSITRLSAIGAEQIVVLNQMNMARLPRTILNEDNTPGTLTAAELWSNQFNAALDAMLDDLVTEKSITTVRFDVFSLVEDIILDPSKYELQNIHESCYLKDEFAIELTGNESICANPDQYLFWDSIHPTTNAHEILFQKLLLKINENTL